MVSSMVLPYARTTSSRPSFTLAMIEKPWQAGVFGYVGPYRPRSSSKYPSGGIAIAAGVLQSGRFVTMVVLLGGQDADASTWVTRDVDFGQRARANIDDTVSVANPSPRQPHPFPPGINQQTVIMIVSKTPIMRSGG